MAHLLFSNTRANAQKTKRAIFCQRSQAHPPPHRNNSTFSSVLYLEKQYKNISLQANTLMYMNRIKEILEEKGIKQTWLADKLGKSYNMVNGYVQNRQQPRLEVLFEIAKILGVEVKDLISEEKK